MDRDAVSWLHRTLVDGLAPPASSDDGWIDVAQRADVPQVRDEVRKRLTAQVPEGTADAAAVVATEFIGRLSAVARLPMRLGAWAEPGHVRVEVTAELTTDRSVVVDQLCWDDRTFGGIIVGDVVTDAGVDFRPMGAVTVWGCVPVE